VPTTLVDIAAASFAASGPGTQAPPPAQGLGTILTLAGVALLTIWAIASLRRRLAGRSTESPAERVRSRLDAARSRQDQQRTIESYASDAEELTRRLAAHLDNKAARIEALLAEASQATDRLQALLERSQSARASDQAAAARPPSVGEVRTDHADRSLWRRRDIDAEDVADTRRPPADPVTRRVYELADDGLPPVEIARELDEHVGKVELILALRSA
jgi:hypothetical protein